MITSTFETRLDIRRTAPLFLFYMTGAFLICLGKMEFGIIALFIVLRLYPYQYLDLFFSKKLYIEEDKVILAIAGFKFPLNEDSWMNISSSFIFGSSYAQLVTLKIARNPKSFFSKLFKNKIKLNVVTQYNFEEMKAEAQKISETFGIRFIDDYDFENEF